LWQTRSAHGAAERQFQGRDNMRITTIVCAGILAGILAGIAGSAIACELPKLIIIPEKAQVAGKEDEIRAAAKTYFTAMEAYSACNLAELTGAGGESAPLLIRQALTRRINAARAEEDFMMKLFQANVGSTNSALPAGASAPPARN